MPLLIFIARVADVSIGTVRIIFVSKGMKFWSAVLGFFEAVLFLVAVGQIMNNLTNIWYYLAYGAGFAMGNYVGILLEEKLAIGLLGVRIIARHNATNLIRFLKENDFGVTSAAARGMDGKAKVVFSVVKRKNFKNFLKIVKDFNPDALISIENVKMASEGDFHLYFGKTKRKKRMAKRQILNRK